jgi:hypothetical protein
VRLAPEIMTAGHVDYLDYGYGTAGLPTAYMVFDEEGVEAWNAAAAKATVRLMATGSS